MNQIIVVGDSEDLVSVPVSHPKIDYDDLLEEFDYWSKLQNKYLVRGWDEGHHHILHSNADYVVHTNSSGSQMGSYASPSPDHRTSLTTTDVRQFRFTPAQSGWRIHRKVRNYR